MRDIANELSVDATFSRNSEEFDSFMCHAAAAGRLVPVGYDTPSPWWLSLLIAVSMVGIGGYMRHLWDCVLQERDA